MTSRRRFWRARGRGRDYSAARATWEAALQVAYSGDWPARIAGPWLQTRDPIVVRRAVALPAGARPLRIVFASDLHVGPTTSAALLDRTFERIRAERPDVLLLGGDYVFLHDTPARLHRLRQLITSVRCPAFAVLGNHDLWADDRAITAALEDAGATVLINRSAPLSDHVDLIGLDDPWAGVCDVAVALSAARADGFRLVFCHNPDGLEYLGDTPFDLFLAGHTHGGQIATPFGPIVVPSGVLCRRYLAGFDRHAGRLIYVSRGIGNVEPPFRLWAPPDILVLELA